MPASAIEMPQPSHARTCVLVAGGFHRGGGMDAANAALAMYLADRGSKVHLVCHRADEDLLAHKMIEVHRVERPAGSFFLGQWLINSSGRRVARTVLAHDALARVLVNGGNCNWPDINWVHYVHHAWRDVGAGGPPLLQAKQRIDKSVALIRERRALARARVVIANSNRTRRDLIELLNVLRGSRAHGLSWKRAALEIADSAASIVGSRMAG